MSSARPESVMSTTGITEPLQNECWDIQSHPPPLIASYCRVRTGIYFSKSAVFPPAYHWVSEEAEDEKKEGKVEEGNYRGANGEGYFVLWLMSTRGNEEGERRRVGASFSSPHQLFDSHKITWREWNQGKNRFYLWISARYLTARRSSSHSQCTNERLTRWRLCWYPQGWSISSEMSHAGHMHVQFSWWCSKFGIHNFCGVSVLGDWKLPVSADVVVVFKTAFFYFRPWPYQSAVVTALWWYMCACAADVKAVKGCTTLKLYNVALQGTTPQTLTAEGHHLVGVVQK